MTIRAFFALNVAMASALCFATGCPQMLEDDFALGNQDLAGSGGASGGSSGSSGSVISAGNAGDGCGSRWWSRCQVTAGAGDSSPDSGAQPSPCAADEDLGPNGACYFAASTEATWDQARASCQERGAGWDLATIRDAEENAFVLSITGFEAWIGATDGTAEGVWRWVKDAAPFFAVTAGAQADMFTNWSVNEPNDADNSDCLRMLATGMWADWECGEVKGHVCQQIPQP